MKKEIDCHHFYAVRSAKRDIGCTLKKKEFGISISKQGYQGKVSPGFHQEGFLKMLACPESLWQRPSIRILLDSRNRVGALDVKLKGKMHQVVIKSFRTRGINRIKSAIVPSKAKKAWYGSSLLSRNDIPTPFPIAFLEKRKRRMVTECYFFSERVKGAQEIRNLFQSLPEEETENLLKELAGLLSRVRKRKILHRDLSDGNVLVCRRKGGYRLFLIDTNRVKEIRFFSLLRSLKSLIRLGIPFHYQRYFLKLYLTPVSLKGFYWKWYRLNKKIFSGYLHIKKKLGIKKIAEALRIQ